MRVDGIRGRSRIGRNEIGCEKFVYEYEYWIVVIDLASDCSVRSDHGLNSSFACIACGRCQIMRSVRIQVSERSLILDKTL